MLVTPTFGVLSSKGPPVITACDSLSVTLPAVAVADGDTTDISLATINIGIRGGPALQTRGDRSGGKAQRKNLKRAVSAPQIGAVKAVRVGSREKSRRIPLLVCSSPVHGDSIGTEMERRGSCPSEDAVNSNENPAHEFFQVQSSGTEAEGTSSSLEYTLQPPTTSLWTPINKGREIKWERTESLKQSNLPPTRTKTKSKKQLYGNIVWKAFTDQLRRHDANLNMAAGRRKKAQELAAERAEEGKAKAVPAKMRLRTVRYREDSPDTDEIFQVVSPVE